MHSTDEEDSEYISDDIESGGTESNEAEVDEDEENADLYIVTSSWVGQQKGDLSIKKDEIIDVLQKRFNTCFKTQ